MLSPAALWLGDVLQTGVTGHIATTLDGIGDGASFGLTGLTRNWISPGLECFVKKNGFYYRGVVASVATTVVVSGMTSGAANTTATTARLEACASELHHVLDPIAQNSRTTAALSTRERTDVLASGGRDLSPAQRALAHKGDQLPWSPGVHAEVTAVTSARTAGLTTEGIAASRPFCNARTNFLQDAGATITSPTTAWWYR